MNTTTPETIAVPPATAGIDNAAEHLGHGADARARADAPDCESRFPAPRGRGIAHTVVLGTEARGLL